MKYLIFLFIPACSFPPLLDSEPSGVAQLGVINVATAGDNSGDTTREKSRDIDVEPKAGNFKSNQLKQ